jgi:hypothetical protein
MYTPHHHSTEGRFANDVIERHSNQMDHPRLLRRILRLVRGWIHSRETAVTEGFTVVEIPQGMFLKQDIL